MEIFRKLGIAEPLLKAIADEHFEKPTEIQEKAIPAVIAGKDVIAGSATGSGKTLVFASGIIQNVIRGAGIQSLILTPTRELAEQIYKTLGKFSKYKPLRIVTVYGGVSINPQIDNLRTADVVVGTPGRVLDHLERRTLNLSKVKIMVLDEADRMLDMGFIDDVTKIMGQCCQDRQTMLFSATIPPDIAHLARRYMKDPIKISAETYVDPRKLIQSYYAVDDNLKFSLLVHLLKHERSGLVMVFCNSRKITDFVAKNLHSNGVEAQAIHGGLSQEKRKNIMERFHDSKVFVLVCTDVVARGLDIPGVSHVYNYDIPKDSKQYIHRVGRTARAGSEGKAVNILASRDHDNFRRVLREYPEMTISQEEVPRIERVQVRMMDRSRDFRNRGEFRRGNKPYNGRGPRRGNDERRPSREGHHHGPRGNGGEGFRGFGSRNGPREHHGPASHRQKSWNN